jgi:asparagine synthase (glutamine-hydrolysing)
LTGLCGIIGGRRREESRVRLETMVSALRDEPFYRSGSYVREDIGFSAGWTCHPGSFGDGLPVQNETGDVLLFIAGEVHLDRGTRAWLKERGHVVDGLGATTLVHLYEEHGPGFVAGLNGGFHGLLVDLRTKTGFLFNDRYGLRRLYVHEKDGEVFFAAQAKALLAVLPETREFDPTGLSEYLTCGCTLGARSMFRAIDVLPAASLWTFGPHGVEARTRYFDRGEWEAQPRLDPDAFARDMAEIMPAVIRRYGEGPLGVGISLTGGVDTRLVLSCLDLVPDRFPCYTFGSMYRDTFDVSIARTIAGRCGQSYRAIPLDAGFLSRFRGFLEDAVPRADGCLSLAGAASLYVNRLAREIAPVRLTGNYGSELLRGVRTFKSQLPKAVFYDPDLAPHLETAQRTFRDLAKNDLVSFSVFHQAPHLGYGLLSVEGSQLTMRTPFLDDDLVRLAYRGPRSYAAGLDLSLAIIGKNRPELLQVPTDFGYLGRGGASVKAARRAYHQALFRAEYLASHGMPRGLAQLIKKAPWLSPEKLLLGRHKYQHFRTWTRRELSGDIRDLLLSDASFPSCLQKKAVERMVLSHLQGDDNYLDEIEKALTVVLDHRILFRAGPTFSSGRLC